MRLTTRRKNHEPEPTNTPPRLKSSFKSPPTSNQSEDTTHLQKTPEYEFLRIPSPSTFHTLPSERATHGFIHRYPRLGECQSLNAILVQYFPENEGAYGEVKKFGNGSTLRTCLVVGDVASSRKSEDQVPKKDDSFRITSVAQEPRNYPFRNRGGHGRRSSSRDEVVNGRTAGENSSGNLAAGTRPSLFRGRTFQQVSKPSSPESRIAYTPASWGEDVDKQPSGWQGCSSSGWSELTELIGPLPWPLVNVDTNGLSSQPELRPFLESRLEE